MCSATLASLWWIVPLLVHARYGTDFLQFTEQPRSIWGTNASTEALRLMAYWTSYIGVGFYGLDYPFFSEAGTLLFNPLVVGASLLLPALAVTGFVWTRRQRYAPFLALVLVVGVVIEVAAFPPGTPAREGMEWVYRNVPLLSFMRTTQKAAPLVAVGVAGLLGIAAQLGAARLRALSRGPVRRAALVAAPAGLAALIALAALPLVRGTAVERLLTWDRIPSAWTQAGPTSTATCRTTRAPSCFPVRSSPTTRGAARSTRSCRGSPIVRSPSATRPRTATPTRPTCSGPSTATSSSGGCSPGSCSPFCG